MFASHFGRWTLDFLSCSSDHGGGWGPVAPPVFKTAWTAARSSEGSTPFLLRLNCEFNHLGDFFPRPSVIRDRAVSSSC
jgi:hypothetical protein